MIPKYLIPKLTAEGRVIFEEAIRTGYITYGDFGRCVNREPASALSDRVKILAKFLLLRNIKSVPQLPTPVSTPSAQALVLTKAPIAFKKTEKNGHDHVHGNGSTNGNGHVNGKNELEPIKIRVSEEHGEVTDSSYERYRNDIGVFPLLTPEEEMELALKVKVGDMKARERMINSNLRLVVHIAKDYAHYGVPILDLISEGNIGLMKGIERFDPARGAKLSTYSSWWIKQSIKRALANQSKTIRLPVHVVDKLFHIRRAESRLNDLFGRDPTDEEIAEELDTTPEKVKEYRQASQRPTQLDAPVGEDGDKTVADLVADVRALDPYRDLEFKTNNQMLKEVLRHLDSREIAIIKYRFGLDGGDEKTLEEVGVKFGITRERIRQIQNIALNKLRKLIEKKEKTDK